jgi:hypothetical protein
MSRNCTRLVTIASFLVFFASAAVTVRAEYYIDVFVGCVHNETATPSAKKGSSCWGGGGDILADPVRFGNGFSPRSALSHATAFLEVRRTALN